MITNSPARYEFYFILYHNFRFMSHTPHCLIQQDKRACADLFTICLQLKKRKKQIRTRTILSLHGSHGCTGTSSGRRQQTPVRTLDTTVRIAKAARKATEIRMDSPVSPDTLEDISLYHDDKDGNGKKALIPQVHKANLIQFRYFNFLYIITD